MLSHDILPLPRVSTGTADRSEAPYAAPGPAPISIIVTTYGTDTYYTQACLESIRRWKNSHHELIVVAHDESALLRAYMEACFADGLIDQLLLAVSGHGHTRSFNLGVRHAHANEIFNICNDILIGPSLVNDCAHHLRSNFRLGLIGWHWYHEGTYWENDAIHGYRLRDESNPFMPTDALEKFQSAQWHTGRAFEALGGPKWICLCNTAFFGVRREVLERIGGGFGHQFRHHFADDALNYAVLDQGLDIRHFGRDFRSAPFFREFQDDNTDVPDRCRHDDRLAANGAFLESIRILNGGLAERESNFLHVLAKATPNDATVTNIGVWRGSSAIVLLDALKDKRIQFYFIDCFDLPGISTMSGQAPVSRQEFLRSISPYISSRHAVNVIRANTLEMSAFPRSDFVFLDAGNAMECICHDAPMVRDCLNPEGTVVIHGYGCPGSPGVKPEVDRVFSDVQSYSTVAVYRRSAAPRLSFEWSGRTSN